MKNKEIMDVPPSTAFKVVDVPDPFREVFERRGGQGTFIGPSEKDSPWVPFGENAAIRHLAFDVSNNVFSNVLWIKKPGVIGTHYHRGRIVMICLEGSARYLEYDWVAYPGGFIQEVPGEAHTLVTEHPQGTKLFGWMQGAIDFYDENAQFVQTADVWWFINHYETYCRENDIPINPQLYI
ncbi:2,4'-dihydroxyacetophenone dioxygenase family protein [Chromohalobacter sp. TMW 2.2308]|uniref:2,4'-dihydroxyacetophenone dioxygenase family protein n=1 Tax=Chromohalobacter moromii TaxID=2860329 RepID=A0A9X3AWI7_9GAMM|nr:MULTISPECIES: 2,4'-dihydroxyacetophenone dioxygenase family protein [Chromohalobacter]MCK2041628.1 2,4'-dihydroxyacetophenone dioxygenase family protein [Chromohalobacter moromii]MCK2044564.1 2,4'-dihydroxyacetophenone dioxygenase family protein [Chromohalobacter moromii]MCT8504282.1 2,4'-dihydroxyacetophenone dioxygenase family protein [Chromohalobacter moromii]MCT8513776.1 2,4'-dihydroxyacetophenone dioxygenase family protein [Chromohalobacter sp. TMW 2.2271]